MKRYYFEEVTKCEMCGDDTGKHKVLGQRLSQSQGLSPKGKTGIAVSVKQCTKCELIYPSPLPIPFDIQDHYGTPPETYWKPKYFEWIPNYYSEEIKKAKEILPFKEGMKALDVGAGLGKAVLSLQHYGFDAYGFEPSIPFYERAISKMNISPDKLKLGALEEVEYEENSFDFITFGVVLEHLYHPASGIERALKWLKPGGLIQLETPSSKYLVSKLLNFYYWLRGTNYVTNLSPFHSPFHLYEFGLKSFEELAPKLGFKVERHRYIVCTDPNLPKVLNPAIKKYMAKTDTGMQLSIYLRKL